MGKDSPTSVTSITVISCWSGVPGAEDRNHLRAGFDTFRADGQIWFPQSIPLGRFSDGPPSISSHLGDNGPPIDCFESRMRNSLRSLTGCIEFEGSFEKMDYLEQFECNKNSPQHSYSIQATQLTCFSWHTCPPVPWCFDKPRDTNCDNSREILRLSPLGRLS